MIDHWIDLYEAEAIAYFRAELARISPGSYTLEEKRQIVEDMRTTTVAAENAMREDFATLGEVEQTMLLGLLGASGFRDRDWWRRMLMDSPLHRQDPTP